MKRVFFVLVALVLVFSSLASAETFRQGDDRISFNQSESTRKTSAYTITSSDSLVNVVTSSADIVITLPSLSSLGSGSKTYKIFKTDSTAYRVIVTPATGNTIGGESTRDLTYQNAYMVVSTPIGSSSDWRVDFESPYVVEDYESATVTINATPTFFGDVTITGITPTLTIGDGGTEDNTLRFDGNTTEGNFQICTDVTDGDLHFGSGTITEACGSQSAFAITDSATPVIQIKAATVMTIDGQLNIDGEVNLSNQIHIVDDTLTTAECGKINFLNAATGVDLILPAPTQGCEFTFILQTVGTSNTTTIATDSGDNVMIGHVEEIANTSTGVSDDNADVITFVNSGGNVGDRCTMIANGTSWYFKCTTGTDGGITTGTT